MRRLLLILGFLLAAAPAAALELKPLVYSLIFPGAGEWSLGYKERALAHFAVEATCWSANVYYRERGFDKRHDYESYADAHWETARWASSFSDTRPGWLDWIPQAEWDFYDRGLQDTAVAFDDSHEDYLMGHFAPYHEDPQHYYENLGKYDWYRWGWDDYDAGTDGTDNRYVYLRMRNASDDDFNVAERFIKFMVVARVVSLADTYIILHKRELGASEREIEAGWRFAVAPSDIQFSGFRLGLTRSW